MAVVTYQTATREGNVPIVLESNQNHATAKETEVCPSIPASMGLGGGYVPMIVEEANMERYVDTWRMWDGTDIAPTLSKSNCGGGRECQIKKTSTVL